MCVERDGTFKLISPFNPQGDQPKAIEKLAVLIKDKNPYQTLLGVTGSGKTFTMASVIDKVNKPTLIISHNKTLAAQLYSEFKEFFPHNAVEYFISYYDYYQPEAYIPQTDTYIEKDASINKKIDAMRLKATTSLMTRNDVIIVASVSCIYNLGSPGEYRNQFIYFKKGLNISRDDILKQLIHIRYERNDVEIMSGFFKVRGDTVEIFLAYEPHVLRVEFFGDMIDRISIIDPVSGKVIQGYEEFAVYPAKHFLVADDQLEQAFKEINSELAGRVAQLNDEGKLLEAQRLDSRTRYDMEMLKELGYCHGIENYSRVLSARPSGSRPYCLLDYFPDDYLVIIDESHVTIPQVRGMYNGDRARKQVLVDFGFRLPSCLDNRPLQFAEFEGMAKQLLYVSATPSDFEINKSSDIVEQVIRPTGLIDPQIKIVSTKNQIDDLIRRVREVEARNQRVLVTTLTKRMAEDLARYLHDAGVAATYLHSELDTLERVKVLADLRKKNVDCVVGVNLLREGLDLPEVSLVCVMDADKEGFLRSATALIQVAGRAARHIDGKVIMYADKMTKSLKKAVDETFRRRTLQLAYNKEHNIKPESIKKAIKDWIEIEEEAEEFVQDLVAEDLETYAQNELVETLERKMELAAKNLQFEKAIEYRNRIDKIKKSQGR